MPRVLPARFRPLRPVTLVFGGLVVLLGLLLLTLPRPWEHGLEAARAAGKSVRLEHFVTTGLWWVTALNLAPALLLLAFRNLWSRPLSGDFPAPSPDQRPPAHAAPAILAAALAASGISLLGNALPRMNQSLWSDEEYTLRRAVFEDYQRKDPARDAIIRRPVEWPDTFWEYRKPNNHVGFSLAARMSLGLLPPRSHPESFRFREWLPRLPALAAALVTLGAVSLVLRHLGWHRAALAAPLWLAWHPWFIRYASEARGYSLMMACLVLATWFGLRAVRSGAGRDWTGLGICQFAAMYAVPGAFPWLVVLNLLLVGMIWTRPGTSLPDRIILGLRWLVAGIGSVMLFLQLMAPNLLQLREFLPSMATRGQITGKWCADALALLGTGLPFHPWDRNNPHCVSHSHASGVSSWLVAGAWVTWIAAFGLGLRVVFRHRTARWLPVLVALPPVMIVTLTAAKSSYLYPWYLIGAVPFLAMLLAAGTEARPAVARWIMPAAFLFFLLLTARQREVLRTVPVEPMAESVRLTRTVVNPLASGLHDVLTVGFVQSTRGYDPALHQIREPAELEELIRRARESGRPLFLNYAMPTLARQVLPDLMCLVDDPELFEDVGSPLYGLEPQNTRHVKRLR